MPRKKAEKRWRDISNQYGFYSYKFGDVRYCVHCNKALPKSELKPDFVTAPIYTWIECKNNQSNGTWGWTEIAADGERKNQRDFLNENGGWLFIELGRGRAPKGVSAWLVPWPTWVNYVEPMLTQNNQASIRRTAIKNQDGTNRAGMLGADELLFGYELSWETNTGWVIPDKHPWWNALHKKMIDELAKVSEHLL